MVEAEEDKTVFEKVIDVSSSDEWCDPVSAARVRLTEADIERLVKASKAVKEGDLSSANIWFYGVEYGFRDEDGSFVLAEDSDAGMFEGAFRTECNEASVTGVQEESWVKFTAYWRHTDIRVTTSEVAFSEMLGTGKERADTNSRENSVTFNTL